MPRKYIHKTERRHTVEQRRVMRDAANRRILTGGLLIDTRYETLQELFTVAKARGLSQAQIAEATGYGERALEDARLGRHEPRHGLVVDLAEYLGAELQLVFPSAPPVPAQTSERDDALEEAATPFSNLIDPAHLVGRAYREEIAQLPGHVCDEFVDACLSLTVFDFLRLIRALKRTTPEPTE